MFAASFVLALVGEEATSDRVRQLSLLWHEWFGLFSFVALVAMFAARWFSKRHSRRPAAKRFRDSRQIREAVLYALLLIQPFSGWLLASLEGKLGTFLGWTPPSLAAPDSNLAEYANAYHALAGGLILLIAAASLQLNMTESLFGSLARLRRRRQSLSDVHKRAGDGT
ncbi:MAG: cytochrome b/b6 domain-containing protein [Roseiarcus sp.]